MHKEELLNLYLEKLRISALIKIEEKEITVLDTLKDSLHCIEGEMSGY